MIKSFNLILITFLLQFSISFSQNYIEGVVSDENESGEIIPFPGVTVFWENTSIGTLTAVSYTHLTLPTSYAV